MKYALLCCLYAGECDMVLLIFKEEQPMLFVIVQRFLTTELIKKVSQVF